MGIKKIINNNEGMVAITTTLIIMILITLIVSSFTLVVRREQRQSLDRQLSTQAFYAAESGVQDAINAINRGDISQDITDCNEFFTVPNAPRDGKISSQLGNVEYSCVLIDRTLPELVYGAISPNDGTYLIPIQPEPGRSIDTIRISWQNVQNPNDVFSNRSVGDFPQGVSLETGMPRVTIMPARPIGRTDLNSRTRNIFMYPNVAGASSSAGQQAYSTADGQVVPGNCNTARASNGDLYCASEITGIGGARDVGFYLAVRSLYKDIKMEITAADNRGTVSLTGAQTQIDVTGKAADVLRRIQVTYKQDGGVNNRTPAQLIPIGALETTNGICKKFEVGSDSFRDLCLNVTTNLNSPTDPEDGNVPTDPPEVTTSVGVRLGNAQIGNPNCFPPGNPNCNTGGNSGDPNAPDFDFRISLPNDSTNPQSTVVGCTWVWGDGTAPQNLPPDRCEYGDWTSHTYPDTRSQIIATNGSQGCRTYTVTLTMRFNDGTRDAVDTHTAYVPQGKANDRPGGICAGKYRTYRP